MKRGLLDVLVNYAVVLGLLLVLRQLPGWVSVLTLVVCASLATGIIMQMVMDVRAPGGGVR